MKKIKLLFLSILLLVTAITLSSCNKTVFYQIAGFYVELVEVDEISVDDKNPKIYFKYGSNDMFSQYSGALASFANAVKSVKKDEDINKYHFSADLFVPENKYDNINIYLIIYKNGKYIVESNDVYKKINKTGTCRYSAEYTFEGDRYRIDFEIRIKNK